MWKICILFCLLMLCFTVCGCNSSADEESSETTSVSQSEKETQAAESVNTTVATEVSTTVSEETTESVEEGRVDFGDFSMIIPDNWVYEGNTPTFYEKSIYDYDVSHGNSPRGIICSIETDEMWQSQADVDNIPINHALVGISNGVYYVAMYPTDVEVPWELRETDMDLYNTLEKNLYDARDLCDEVFATIEFND